MNKYSFNMRVSIEGWLFNRIEKIGGKEVNHLGFEEKEGEFGDMLASIVPKIDMRKKVRITLEVIE